MQECFEEVYDYLLERAKENNIVVHWAHFDPYTPPGSDTEYRSVAMNIDWHNQDEIPFQLAHELSHIINGDEGDVFYYHACFTGKESVEYKANVGAVKLLVPFYCQEIDEECVNKYDFVQAFDVPTYLTGAVSEQIQEYYVN